MRFLEVPALITEDIEDPNIVDITEPITASISGTTLTIDGDSKVSGETTITLTNDVTVSTVTTSNIRQPSIHKITIKTNGVGNFTYTPNAGVTASSVSTTTKTGSDLEILLITTSGGETYLDLDVADYVSPAANFSNVLTGFNVSDLTSAYGTTAKLYKPDGTLLTTVNSATTGSGVNFGYTESSPGDVIYKLEVTDDVGRKSKYNLPRKWINYAMETTSTPGFQKFALEGNEYTSTVTVPNLSSSSKARIHKTTDHGYMGIKFRIQGRNSPSDDWVDVDDTGENENADESAEFLAFGNYIYHRVWVKPTAQASTTVSSSNVVTLTLSNVTEDVTTKTITGADPFHVDETSNVFVFEETVRVGTVPFTVNVGGETYTNAVTATTEEIGSTPNTDMTAAGPNMKHQITVSSLSRFAQVSGDGKYIAWANTSGLIQVVKGDPENGYTNYTTFTHSQSTKNDLFGSISYDGKYIINGCNGVNQHHEIWKHDESAGTYSKITQTAPEIGGENRLHKPSFVPRSGNYDFAVTGTDNNSTFRIQLYKHTAGTDTWTAQTEIVDPTSKPTGDANRGRYAKQFTRDGKYLMVGSTSTYGGYEMYTIDWDANTAVFSGANYVENNNIGHSGTVTLDGKYVLIFHNDSNSRKIFKNNDAGDWSSATDVTTDFTFNNDDNDQGHDISFCGENSEYFLSHQYGNNLRMYSWYANKEITLTYNGKDMLTLAHNGGLTTTSVKLYKDDVLYHTFGSELSVFISETGVYQAVSDERYYSAKVTVTTITETEARLYVNNATTFLLKKDGKVWYWGESHDGSNAMGNGTEVALPTLNTNLNALPSGIKQLGIYSNDYHACCAITNDGKLYTWGRNANGQLGRGNTSGYTSEGPWLVDTQSSNTFTMCHCGYYANFALQDNGYIWSCGYNGQYTLGTGNNSQQTTFYRINLPNVIDFHAQHDVALAVTSENKVYIWGTESNSWGQMGGATGTTGTPTHMTALDGKNIVKVRAGGYSGHAISSDGKMYSWGKGQYYAVPDGTTNNVSTPTEMTWFSRKNIKLVDAQFPYDEAASCLGLDDQGNMYVWGEDDNGTIGVGPGDSSPGWPFLLKENIASITVGRHSCGCIDKFGQVYTWGDGARGQQNWIHGTNSDTDINLPTSNNLSTGSTLIFDGSDRYVLGKGSTSTSSVTFGSNTVSLDTKSEVFITDPHTYKFKIMDTDSVTYTSNVVSTVSRPTERVYPPRSGTHKNLTVTVTPSANDTWTIDGALYGNGDYKASMDKARNGTTQFAWNVFNGIIHFDYLRTDSGITSAAIQLHMPQKIKLTKYALYSRYFTGNYTNAPKDWKVYGSNDNGTNWTELDSQTNQTVTAWGSQLDHRDTKREYTVTGNTKYFSSYKLDVTATGGGQVDLNQIEYYGDEEGFLSDDGFGKLTIDVKGDTDATSNITFHSNTYTMGAARDLYIKDTGEYSANIYGSSKAFLGEKTHTVSANATELVWNSNETHVLYPGSVTTEDLFGNAVAFDGNYAIIGSNNNDSGGDNRGMVYIFHKSGGTWTQQASLQSKHIHNTDNFGMSVDISGDYAIVGAFLYDEDWPDTASNRGAAYIFKREGTAWREQTHLQPSDPGADDYFGNNVRISGDYAIVGSPYNDSPDNSGSSYVFKKTSTTLSTVRNPIFTDASTIETNSNWSSSTGFEITASGESSSSYSQKWRAFDNTHTSVDAWESTWLSQSSMPAWVQIQYPEDVVIKSYTIVGRDATNRYYPTSWQLQGATAAAPTTYVNLETNSGNRTASSWAPLAEVSHDVNSSNTAYRYFRLYVNSSNESNQVSINELKLFTTPLSGQSGTVEDSWAQEQKLTASDAASHDEFGLCTDLSGDYAIIGANSGSQRPGSAYIFKRNEVTSSTVSEHPPSALTGTESGGGGGYKVTSSSDAYNNTGFYNWKLYNKIQGNEGWHTAGTFNQSNNDHNNTQSLGGVSGEWNKLEFPAPFVCDYVIIYERNDGTSQRPDDWVILGSNDDSSWTQLVASTTLPTTSGATVQISDTNSYKYFAIVVKSTVGNVEGTIGELKYFGYMPSLVTWSQQAKIQASDGATGDRFGKDVALSGDYAIVGAYNDDSAKGSAYIFKKDTGAETWSQQQKLIASDGATSDAFGWSVDINSDTAVVGAYHDDSYTGSAYIFERSGTAWTEVKKITASGGAGGHFGNEVFVDGTTVLVGSPVTDTKGSNTGAAYMFEKALVAVPTLNFDGYNKLSIDNFNTSAVNFTDVAITGTAYYAGSMTWSDNKLTSSAANGWVKGRARTTTKFNKSTIAGVQFRVSRKEDYWNMQILTPDDTETWMTSSTDDVIAQNQKPFIGNQNGSQGYNVYSGGYSAVKSGNYVSDDLLKIYFDESKIYSYKNGTLLWENAVDSYYTSNSEFYVVFGNTDAGTYGQGNVYDFDFVDSNGTVVKSSAYSATIKKDGAAFATTTSNTVYIRETGTYTAEVQGPTGYVTEVSKQVNTLATKPDYTNIWAGERAGMVVDSEGKLYTWGENGNNQSGRGASDRTPTHLSTISDPVSNVWVEGAPGRTRIVKTSTDKWYMWGMNGSHSKIFGETAEKSTPVDVTSYFTTHFGAQGTSDSTRIIKVVMSANACSALAADGKVWSWGKDESRNELGKNTNTTTTTPFKNTTDGTAELSNITDIRSLHYGKIALDSNGDVWQWGQIRTGSTGYPTKQTGLDSITIIGIGSGFFTAYAWDAAGNIYTLGQGNEGQLGNGADSNQDSTWQTVTTLQGKTIYGIYGAGYSVFAHTSDGVYACGQGANGRLGMGNNNNLNVFTKSTTLSALSIYKIDFGHGPSYIITTDGKGYAWGGDSNNSIPTPLSGDKNVPTEASSISDLSLVYQPPAITYDGKNKLTVGGTNYADTSTVTYYSNTYNLGTAKTMYVKDTGEYVFKINGTDKYVESNVYVSSVDLAGATTKPISFDGYNILTLISPGTNAVSNLTYFSNTYEMGSASTFYIKDTGTYDLEMSGSNVFALSSNVVNTISEPAVSGTHRFKLENGTITDENDNSQTFSSGGTFEAGVLRKDGKTSLKVTPGINKNFTLPTAMPNWCVSMWVFIPYITSYGSSNSNDIPSDFSSYTTTFGWNWHAIFTYHMSDGKEFQMKTHHNWILNERADGSTSSGTANWDWKINSSIGSGSLQQIHGGNNSDNNIWPEAWHHIACEYKSETGKLTFYIDGNASTLTGTFSTGCSLSGFTLGDDTVHGAHTHNGSSGGSPYPFMYFSDIVIAPSWNIDTYNLTKGTYKHFLPIPNPLGVRQLRGEGTETSVSSPSLTFDTYNKLTVTNFDSSNKEWPPTDGTRSSVTRTNSNKTTVWTISGASYGNGQYTAETDDDVWSSGSHLGYPDMAFNKSLTTPTNESGFITSNTPQPVELRITLPNAIVLGSYKLQGRDRNDTSETPGTWTMEGSNDGTTWTVLDTQTAANPALDNSKTATYTVSGNSTAYNRYKLNITATNATGGGATIIGELYLYEQNTRTGTLTDPSGSVHTLGQTQDTIYIKDTGNYTLDVQNNDQKAIVTKTVSGTLSASPGTPSMTNFFVWRQNGTDYTEASPSTSTNSEWKNIFVDGNTATKYLDGHSGSGIGFSMDIHFSQTFTVNTAVFKMISNYNTYKDLSFRCGASDSSYITVDPGSLQYSSKQTITFTFSSPITVNKLYFAIVQDGGSDLYSLLMTNGDIIINDLAYPLADSDKVLPSPVLNFDTYNKLTIANVDSDATSNIEFFSNTYEMGSRKELIINDAGTYHANIYSSNTLALVKKQVNTVTNFNSYTNTKGVHVGSDVNTAYYAKTSSTFSNNILIGDKNYSVSYWINITSSALSQSESAHIWWGNNSANDVMRLGFGTNSGKKTLSLQNNSCQGNIEITPDVWHHIVLARQSSPASWISYVDGVKDDMGNGSQGDVSTNREMYIGYTTVDGGVGYIKDAYMDDISIWNKTLTQSDVDSIYGAGPSNLNSHASAANLMAWWKFEDNGDDSATGSSNNLTINNTGWYSSSAVAKKSAPSLTFDGYNKLTPPVLEPTFTATRLSDWDNSNQSKTANSGKGDWPGTSFTGESDAHWWTLHNNDKVYTSSYNYGTNRDAAQLFTTVTSSDWNHAYHTQSGWNATKILKLGYKFTVGSKTLGSMKLWQAPASYPTGDVTIKYWDGTSLKTVTNQSPNGFPSSISYYTEQEFTFNSANAQYWLIECKTHASSPSTNYIGLAGWQLLSGRDPVTTVLTKGSDSYDIGTASSIYINDTGTYDAQAKNSNTFIIKTSNTMSGSITQQTLFSTFSKKQTITGSSNFSGAWADQNGNSLSMNYAGTRAVIASGWGSGGNVYIYHKDSSGTWSLDTTLTAPSSISNFGHGLDMSSDGNRIFVIRGVYNTDAAGRIFVYDYSSGWSNTPSATLSEPSRGNGFARRGYCSPDGNTCGIVSTGGNDRVYTWKYSGGSWQTTPDYIETPSEGEDFGCGFSFNTDGTRMLVGAKLSDEGGADRGRAYICDYSSGWTISHDLAGQYDGENFGEHVRINGAGTRAAIGARYNDEGGTNRGRAYIWDRNSGTGNWSLTQDIASSVVSNNSDFGGDLFMNKEGDRVIIGASRDDTLNTNQGSVHVYDRQSNGQFTLVQTMNGESSNERFGFSIGSDQYGNYILIGAPVNNRVFFYQSTISSPPSLTYDNANKLSLTGVTTPSSNLTVGTNTYDIGSAKDVYIKDQGTYTFHTNDGNQALLMSNVVSSTPSGTTYAYSTETITNIGLNKEIDSVSGYLGQYTHGSSTDSEVTNDLNFTKTILTNGYPTDFSVLGQNIVRGSQTLETGQWHSNNQTDPWFRINLEKDYYVDNCVLHRTSTSTTRYQNVRFQLLDSSETQIKEVNVGDFGSVITFVTADCKVSGVRYVKVVTGSTSYTHYDEIRINGYDPTILDGSATVPSQVYDNTKTITVSNIPSGTSTVGKIYKGATAYTIHATEPTSNVIIKNTGSYVSVFTTSSTAYFTNTVNVNATPTTTSEDNTIEDEAEETTVSVSATVAFHDGTFADSDDPHSDGSITAAATAGHVYSDTATGTYTWGTLTSCVRTAMANNEHSTENWAYRNGTVDPPTAGFTTYKWTPPGAITNGRTLVVAGGGGGGTDMGGGGGAGGMLASTTTNIAHAEQTIQVGGPGSRGYSNQASNMLRGGNGADSSISGPGITAVGGGGGASKHNYNTRPAGNGGSGGGGSGGRASDGNHGGERGTGIPGQGHDGARSGNHWYPAGGGGAGEKGYGRDGTNNSNTLRGDGGNGLEDDILGTSYWWAGGGGCNTYYYGYTQGNIAGKGGKGGGGGGAPPHSGHGPCGPGPGDTNGITNGQDGDAATANWHRHNGGSGGKHTGGGGGGGDHHDQSDPTLMRGGLGGSGIVAIKFTAQGGSGESIPGSTAVASSSTTDAPSTVLVATTEVATPTLNLDFTANMSTFPRTLKRYNNITSSSIGARFNRTESKKKRVQKSINTDKFSIELTANNMGDSSSSTSTLPVTVVNSGAGTQYTSGWTTVGSTSSFVVPSDAPNALYYYCQNHDGMGGSISVTSATTTTHTVTVVSSSAGTQYTSGWTVSGTPGSSGATSTFVAPSNAPSTLYYYCGNHSGMGGAINMVSGPVSTTFAVTVQSVSGYYGSSNKYFIDGTQQATISLVRGKTYTFNNNASGSHPMYFATSSDGTTYTSGVTNGGTSSVTFAVPLNAPSTLYYKCGVHGGMGGTIHILGPTASPLAVTVAGGKFVIGGVSQATLQLVRGETYVFNQENSTNGTHPLRLSTTSNGTHVVGGSGFYIGGTQRPTLSMVRGNTYTFDQTNASNGSHVLQIATASDGTQYTSGYTTGTFVVPLSAPDTLYYKSSTTAGMGGLINVTGSSTSAFVVTAGGGKFSIGGVQQASLSVIRGLTYTFNQISGHVLSLSSTSDGTRNTGVNKYYISGVETPTLTFIRGSTYTFTQATSTNTGHPIRLSETSNGTHASGSQYTSGWTTTGTPGSSGASSQFIVPANAPSTLYYYCQHHSGMGGASSINVADSNSGIILTYGTHALVANSTVSGEHTIATNFDGTTSNLYVDGVLITQTTPTIASGAKTLKIGEDYNGLIKNLKFWNKPISYLGITVAFHYFPFASGGDPYSDGSVTAAATAGHVYSDTPTGTYTWGTLGSASQASQQATYTWTPISGSFGAKILMVAGGGGGAMADNGNGGGGGGGAGGLLYNASVFLSGQKTIKVGGPGSAITTNGADTEFTGLTTAIGGGKGSGGGGGGASGGSGGGGFRNGSGYAGTAGQGYAGGDGNSSGGTDQGGSGGGGAGGAGAGANGANGANGGVGLDYSSVFGTAYGDSGWFASGGGGGFHSGSPGTASNGGGGAGGSSGGSAGGQGQKHTGGGGGGGSIPAGSNNGSYGASGIVLIKY